MRRLDDETPVRQADTLVLIRDRNHDHDDELQELLRQFTDSRHRRRSVRGGRALIALLAAALLSVWLLRPPLTGGDENRAETGFPELSAAGLVNGTSYHQTDAALRDRLALRRYVAIAIGDTARDRLGTSLNPKVVLGEDGTPFLTEDFTLPCQFGFNPAQVDEGLRDLREAATRTGRTITVAIAPDKSSILSNLLGRREPALLACSSRVRHETEQTWGTRAQSPVLTTWNQLAAANQAAPGRIFQPGDSHWTSQGSLVWAQALISKLIAQGEAPAALQGAPHAVDTGAQPADGDLYRLMGIERSGTVPNWTVTRPEVNVRAKTQPSPSGRGLALFHAWPADGADDQAAPLIQGRTLVVDDSFFSRAEGQLAPYFTDLEVMHWVDFLTLLQEGRLPAFDRIVLETVQRGWPERAGWLQPGQPVHDALAKELSSPG